MPQQHVVLSESRKLTQRAAALGKKLFNENMMTTSMVMGDMASGGDHSSVDALGQPPMGVHKGTRQMPGFQTMMHVTGYRDESAKGLLGIGQEFMVDTTTNPMMTNLLDQDGAYVSIDDIKDFFHFEPLDMDPSNDSSQMGTEMMQTN